MNYRTFEDNQNKIYEQDIFGYNWLEKGIEKDKKITFDIEGILVGLGFNKKLRNHLAKTSRKIAEVIPAMVFSENELHTSLIYVRTNEKASDFSAIKEYLFETYEHAIQKGFDIPEILFRKPTLTKNGAIMPGLAGKNFFLLMEMLYCQYFLKVPQEIEGKNTKKLIKGWGGHQTLLRSLKTMSGRKLSSGGIEDILNSEPIEELVRPTELFIAKYSFKKNNHYVTKLKSTRL